MSNSKFETPIEMVVKVPMDFNPDTCIDDNAKIVKGLKETNNYHKDLSSANFSNPSNELIPGKEYLVKLIPVKKGEIAASTECFDEISKHRGILVGGQGLTVLDIDKLPKGKYYVSFDQPKNLWKDSDGSRRVPSLDASSDGDFHWRLGSFERGYYDGGVLVCFCEYEKGDEIPKNSFLDTVEILKDGSIIFT